MVTISSDVDDAVSIEPPESNINTFKHISFNYNFRTHDISKTLSICPGLNEKLIFWCATISCQCHGSIWKKKQREKIVSYILGVYVSETAQTYTETEIFVTGCIGSCSKWWTFRQNDIKTLRFSELGQKGHLILHRCFHVCCFYSFSAQPLHSVVCAMTLR